MAGNEVKENKTNPRDEAMHNSLETQIKRRMAMRRSGVGWLLVTGGTAGLLLCVPIIGGAYLGRWIDMQLPGFSSRWTISLIVLGIALGAYNLYRFFQGINR